MRCRQSQQSVGKNRLINSRCVSERGLTVSERGLTVSERGLTVSERGLTVSERGSLC